MSSPKDQSDNRNTERRGVNLSPSSMTDSMSDWPLSQVAEHLRRREDESKERIQPSRLHCRSTIKSLMDVMDVLASGYKVPRNRMCRWLSYHAAVMSREDTVISRLSTAQGIIRDICLREDDTNTLDIMRSLTPYSPKSVDESDAHLMLYDVWVASDFEEHARVCGVHRFRVVQVYMVKSILSGDTECFGETISRFLSEMERWDNWMDFRLGAMENLVRRKTECPTNPQ